VPGNGHINGWYQPGSDRSGQERSHLTLHSATEYAQAARAAMRVVFETDCWISAIRPDWHRGDRLAYAL
jgi:hypothetical protein